MFTLTQVALNDTIMVFAFAPIVGLLLGISAITVPWDTLFTSVVLYIVIPVILAQLWRRSLLRGGQAHVRCGHGEDRPVVDAALLATLVLLFAFQGKAILQQPLVIALLAVPILIQVFFNSALAYWLNRALGEKHDIACPSALIGASQLLRTGGRGRHQPVRFRVGRRAGHRRRRADRSAGDAAGGEGREFQQGLVRTGQSGSLSDDLAAVGRGACATPAHSTPLTYLRH